MNKIAESILNKIDERAEQIRKLISDVKNTIGESAHIEVDINGLTYGLESDSESVSASHWIESNDYESGGHWYVAIVFAPNSDKWGYKCSADRAWDGMATDMETLKNLKRLFDAEKVEMDAIQKVLDAYKSSNDAVTDFFGIA